MTSETFYKKIKNFGSRKGLSNEDSEDFASYATIYYLQGRKASFKQFYVDFMRKRFGNTRSSNFELQRNIKNPRTELNEESLGDVDLYLEQSLDIKRALDTLTSRERYLIYLRHHCGHTAGEISVIMKVSRKTIWDRLKIVYQKLREEL